MNKKGRENERRRGLFGGAFVCQTASCLALWGTRVGSFDRRYLCGMHGRREEEERHLYDLEVEKAVNDDFSLLLSLLVENCWVGKESHFWLIKASFYPPKKCSNGKNEKGLASKLWTQKKFLFLQPSWEAPDCSVARGFFLDDPTLKFSLCCYQLPVPQGIFPRRAHAHSQRFPTF